MNLSFRKAALLTIALATAAYGVIELSGPNGFSALEQKRREMEKMEADNQRLRAENDRLRKRVDDLGSNPAAQELEIRKRYHMVKPGETVYVLQDKSAKSHP